jgi:hypothetical protein
VTAARRHGEFGGYGFGARAREVRHDDVKAVVHVAAAVRA